MIDELWFDESIAIELVKKRVPFGVGVMKLAYPYKFGNKTIWVLTDKSTSKFFTKKAEAVGWKQLFMDN